MDKKETKETVIPLNYEPKFILMGNYENEGVFSPFPTTSRYCQSRLRRETDYEET